jgi:GT2 family glycosyltransferase
MRSPYELSILIVNWNSKEFLRRCLTSVEAGTSGIPCETIVIDSGSFDGCAEMLLREFPRVKFIQSLANIGFARANNMAFRASTGHHVLFLNPDTEVVGPAIRVLLTRLRGLHNAGAIGCRLLNADGSAQDTCIQAFPTILSQFLNSRLLRDARPRSAMWGNTALLRATDAPAPVEAISGACMLMRRYTFEQVGMFSEDYFMYAEDLDLCHKIIEAGYTNYFVGEATIRHFGGGSSDQAGSEFSVVMMRESIWRFLTKTRGDAYATAYRASTGVLAVMRLLLLIALWPIQALRHRAVAWRASFRKWRAILIWSLGHRAGAAVRSNP